MKKEELEKALEESIIKLKDANFQAYSIALLALSIVHFSKTLEDKQLSVRVDSSPSTIPGLNF